MVLDGDQFPSTHYGYDGVSRRPEYTVVLASNDEAAFILFPPVLQQLETHHSQKVDAGLGVAFALVASGFVPIFLLPFLGTQAANLSSREQVWFAVRIARTGLTCNFRLCLAAGLLGTLDIVIHLAYGLKTSNILVTALVLAVSQLVCFTAVLWLRSSVCRQGMSLCTRLRHGDPTLRRLEELKMKDESARRDKVPFNQINVVPV